MEKTGRNSPCPCGSTLKYKKCCLPKQEEQETIMRQLEEENLQKWLEEDLKQGQKNIEDMEKKD
jgi:hypothetical protein